MQQACAAARARRRAIFGVLGARRKEPQFGSRSCASSDSPQRTAPGIAGPAAAAALARPASKNRRDQASRRRASRCATLAAPVGPHPAQRTAPALAGMGSLRQAHRDTWTARADLGGCGRVAARSSRAQARHETAGPATALPSDARQMSSFTPWAAQDTRAHAPVTAAARGGRLRRRRRALRPGLRLARVPPPEPVVTTSACGGCARAEQVFGLPFLQRARVRPLSSHPRARKSSACTASCFRGATGCEGASAAHVPARSASARLLLRRPPPPHAPRSPAGCLKSTLLPAHAFQLLKSFAAACVSRASGLRRHVPVPPHSHSSRCARARASHLSSDLSQ